MPRSKPPKKRYVPKPVRMPANIRYSEADELQLQLVPHISLDLFRSGDATEGDWHTLACRINWGSALASRHHPELLDLAAAGVRALASAFERHGRTGKWGCSGEELRAIGAALVQVDDLQHVHTRRELLDALRLVLRVAGRRETVGDVMEVEA